MSETKRPKAQLERGLPESTDTERIILGCALNDDTMYADLAVALDADDFALQAHRRIYASMARLHALGKRIDHVTVSNDLMEHSEFDACGGLAYLVSLEDGTPQLPKLDSYIEIVREKARKRRIIFAAQHLMNRAIFDMDPSSEILADASANFLGMAAAASTRPKARSIGEIIEAEGGLEHLLTGNQSADGIVTGYNRFDGLIGSLARGEMSVIGARPSMGKTALALNIGLNVARQPDSPGVLCFSLEMKGRSLLLRLLSAAARVDSFAMRLGRLNRDERARVMEAAVEISGLPIWIDDSSRLSPPEIYSRVRQHTPRVGLVIADYLQIMAPPKGRYSNRNEEIGAISGQMKATAKELNVHVMVLSTLSRAVEQRGGDCRPILADLRESGTIEADADIVAFLYRQFVYRPHDESLRHEAELLIRKNRNGPTGDAPLVWLSALTRFENRVDT